MMNNRQNRQFCEVLRKVRDERETRATASLVAQVSRFAFIARFTNTKQKLLLERVVSIPSQFTYFTRLNLLKQASERSPSSSLSRTVLYPAPLPRKRKSSLSSARARTSRECLSRVLKFANENVRSCQRQIVHPVVKEPMNHSRL